MQKQTVGQVLSEVTLNSINKIYGYLPQFIGGLVILLFGLFAAAFVKRAVRGFFRLLNFKNG